jgi:hypothetical protein
MAAALQAKSFSLSADLPSMRSSVGPHASSRQTRKQTGDWIADSKTNDTISQA